MGGATEQLEGDWKPVFPVMIEFPDVGQARAWYFSDDYRDLKRFASQGAASMQC
jgi:uncharacterized protein (DUF1330 family)